MSGGRIDLASADGVRLSATWDAPERAGEGGVLLLPGWWRRAESPRLRELALALARRHPVMTLDFRGHGRSSGSFTFGRSEHLDVEAALAEMARRGVRSVALVGLSMGGAAAIVTAGREAELPLRLAGVLAVAAPSDFGLIRPAPWRGRRDVAWADAWRLPRTSLACAWSDKLAPSAHVAGIGAPLRLVHGREDWLVHHEHGERLHRASCGGELLVVDERGLHADELLGRVPQMMARLVQPFVAAALLGPSSPAPGEGEPIDPAPWRQALAALAADPALQSPDLGGLPLSGPVGDVRAVAARDGAHLALLVGGRPAWARGLRDGSAHGLNLLATQLVTDGPSWSQPLRLALRRALLELSAGPPRDVTRFVLVRRGAGGLEARPEAARP